MVGPYSSGEELVIKTRKPYTITKQRERWTEEEHNRFLEALKLYGRAWQRIEEHIGTKTAVQIRSHAQKFFTKLEKEAIAKGVPVGQSIDIEIPPPRPKRKPSNPYPRKTSAGAYTSQGGTEYGTLLTSGSFFSSDEDKRHLEEKTPPKNHCGDENIRNVEERQDEDICSQTFMGFLENASTHLSSANESSLPREEPPRNSCSSDEYLPLTKELTNQDETIESFITFEPKGKQKFDKDDAKTKILESGGTSNTTNLENSHHSHEKLVQSRKVDELSQPENFSQLPADEVQATQNYPRHVPVHILDGSLGMKAQQESTDPAASPKHHNNAPTSSIPHPFPTLHPLFPPIHNNEEDYQPFLHIPSAFSSLIVSALLQNPAAHAAASFAASFWPCSNIESSPDSAAGSSPSNQMNSAPSMVAIAAATVAAASAWWAAHGLLPYSAPFHSGFTEQWHSCFYNSHPGFQGQQLDQKHFKSMEEQNSASKSPTLSISESEESEGAKMNTGVTDADTRQQSVPPTELHDSSKIKSRKQLERSSCGSNTPSSSEVETNDQVKHEKCTDESREPDASHIGSDSCNRRSRSSSNVNDSWKLVSEVGRMAFQALFSREVLPQSFSAPHDQKYDRYQQSNSQDNRNTDERRNLHETEAATSLQLDLNRTSVICSDHQGTKNNIFFIGDNNVMLGQGKLKAHRTGFKPYKRCSMEAKESKVASSNCPGEERRPKRICLQGESST